MSRDVTTRCVAMGPVDAFVRFALTVRDGRLLFDFDKIIPIPDVIRRIPRSGRLNDDEWPALKALKASPDLSLESINSFVRRWAPPSGSLGELQLNALIQTGYTNQIDWLLGNWGCVSIGLDLGIHHHSPGFLDFIFDTRPVFPLGIFHRLAQMFPDVRFHCSSCEEAGEDPGEGFFNGEPAFRDVPLTAQLYEWVRGTPLPYSDGPPPYLVETRHNPSGAPPFPPMGGHHVPQ